MCANGKWDVDKPICVKFGCHAPSTVDVNGQFIESYRGAVVKIICNPGYSLVGSPSVYCNGYRWNETFPICTVTTTKPALSCDFENSDLCGWSQDPMHDFDWRRVKGSSVGENLTEPVFDHTFGENGTGNFMQMGRFKSSLENATARLYSPVYPPHYSVNSCFTFWYYMQGINAGSLKIYVKPERTELYNLIPFFWVNEEPGKSWIEGFFSLRPTNSRFQIVVEGVKGPGYANDTGFDDVKLGFGEECAVPEEPTTTTEFSTSVSSTDDDIFSSTPFSGSCKNKCNEAVDNESCQCNSTCLKNGNCCPDFNELCNLLPVSSSTARFATSTSRKVNKIITTTTPLPRPKVAENVSSSTTRSAVPTSRKVTKITSTTSTTQPPRPKMAENGSLPSNDPLPLGGANNESNHIDPHNPIISMPPIKVTNVSGNLNRTVENTVGTVKPKSKPINTEAEKNKNKFTQWKIPSFEPPNITFPKPKVNKMETQGQKENREKEISSKAVAPAENFPRERVDVSGTVGKKNATEAKDNHATSSTTISASTTLINPRSNRLNWTKYEKASAPALSNSIESGLYKRKPKELPGKEPPQAIKIEEDERSRKTTLRGILEIGGAALVLLIIIMLGVIWYRRSKSRKTERENMIEDSDSILYETDSSTLGSETHSLVCIRPKGLQKSH